ncbi:MAG: hypothetical protein ACFFDS_00485 [Candidatus Thorarchaeota archaeon]
MTDYSKKELLLYYGSAYIIIAILETILFSIIIGRWSFYDIFLNFSIWGITWLVTMFAFPMFFTDAQQSTLALSGYLALIGYVIIIAGYYFAYYLHTKSVEKRFGKKPTFRNIIDLYFPPPDK